MKLSGAASVEQCSSGTCSEGIAAVEHMFINCSSGAVEHRFRNCNSGAVAHRFIH